MASAEAGQPAPYRCDDAGKFANTAAEPDAPGAKPAAPGPEAAPQFTSLLSHVGTPRDLARRATWRAARFGAPRDLALRAT
jgi:hypothetical protein